MSSPFGFPSPGKEEDASFPGFLKLLERLSPERTLVLGRLARVLCEVADTQPVGRRALASRLGLTEREIRSLAEELRAQGFLEFDGTGMKITPDAAAWIPEARRLTRRLFAPASMEERLSRLLNLTRCVVISGDAQEDGRILSEVCRAAGQTLVETLTDSSTLAVGGGSTMAEVARNLPAASFPHLMVVPLRGGIGSVMEGQASVIAAEIAERLGGQYRLIHLPDNLDGDTLREMLKMDEVRRTVDLIRRADVAIHGIGRADEMASKRGLDAETCRKLLSGGAEGEAFGAFFDLQGRLIHRLSTPGGDLAEGGERRMIACAAGSSKARAIIAALRANRYHALVTDGAAAGEILSLLEGGA